jgi:hypothetical protein
MFIAIEEGRTKLICGAEVGVGAGVRVEEAVGLVGAAVTVTVAGALIVAAGGLDAKEAAVTTAIAPITAATIDAIPSIGRRMCLL